MHSILFRCTIVYLANVQDIKIFKLESFLLRYGFRTYLWNVLTERPTRKGYFFDGQELICTRDILCIRFIECSMVCINSVMGPS